MRLGNKSVNMFISINLFDTDNVYFFSLFSDSLYMNQLLQITRKLSLLYTSKASHFPISQLLEGAIIGAHREGNEQGLCFSKWNLGGEHSLVLALLRRCETGAAPQHSFPESYRGPVPTDASGTKR